MIYVLAVLALGFRSIEATPIDHSNELTAIRDVYDDNRNRFDSGAFSFDYTKFSDITLENAKAGLFNNAVSTNGSYAFDGGNAIFSQIFPDDIVRANSVQLEDGKISSHLLNFRALTNEQLTLLDYYGVVPGGEFKHSAQIFPGTTEFYQALVFPIDLGFPDMARHDLSKAFNSILNGPSRASVKSISSNDVFDGIKVATVVTTFRDVIQTWRVDLSRGGVPIARKYEMASGNWNIVILSDIRLMPNQGWLPHKLLFWTSTGYGYVIQIKSAQLGPVPSTAFRLEFSKPISIRNQAEKVSYSSQKIWDLRNLPKPGSPNAHPYRVVPAVNEPEMPPEVKSASPNYILYLILAGSTGTVIYFLVRRFRG